MVTPNEFWLALHELAAAYDAEGSTEGEREQNIMHQLQRMPPAVQRQLLADMQRIAAHVDELFVSARDIVLEAEMATSAPQGKAG